MPDKLLDAPDLIDRRRQMWTNILTKAAPSAFICAAAEHDGEIVGIVMSGPPENDAEPAGGSTDAVRTEAIRPEDRHLYVLYAYRSVHGTGVGQDLLDAVLDASATTALWVADPNPRAQAFYAKNGFVADGTVKTDEYDGVREVRMVRPGRA